jgi:heme exporter protein D
MLLVGAGSYAWDDALVMPNILFWIGFLFVSWDGLCRPASSSPSVYEPFVRLGWAGRMAGRLLYPGWASSVVFSLATLGLFLLGLVWGGETIEREEIEITRLFIGAFLFPFAVLLWVGLGRRFFGLSMFLFQLALVLILVLLHLFDEFGHTHLTLAACWSPTSVLILYIMEDFWDSNVPYQDVYMIASLVMTALSLVAIAIKAFPQRRLVIRMEKQAQANRQSRRARESVVAPPVLETSS